MGLWSFEVQPYKLCVSPWNYRGPVQSTVIRLIYQVQPNNYFLRHHTPVNMATPYPTRILCSAIYLLLQTLLDMLPRNLRNSRRRPDKERRSYSQIQPFLHSDQHKKLKTGIILPLVSSVQMSSATLLNSKTGMLKFKSATSTFVSKLNKIRKTHWTL